MAADYPPDSRSTQINGKQVLLQAKRTEPRFLYLQLLPNVCRVDNSRP